MTVQNNPHDRFFRRTFGEREMAQEFLRHYLPPALQETLNLDTLTPTNTSVVDEELAEHQNDLLYEVQTSTGRDLHLYILLEHKSYPDKWVTLQLLGYMLKLWQKEVDEKATVLRPILPILVYHGEVVWPFGTSFRENFAELPAALRPYVPDFTAVLYDLSPRANLELEGDLTLQAVLLALRHILDRRLAERLEWLMSFVFQMAQDPSGERLRNLIVYYYLTGTNKISRADMEQALKLQGSVGDKAMRTIAMEYWEEGWEEAREEGMVLSSQKAVANVLKARFMILPPLVEERIKQVTDTAVLEKAVPQAALVENIEQFMVWLEETSS